MAGHPTTIPAATVVGNAFANQYYNVLHNSPEVAYRFYTDASRITRADAGPDVVVDTVVTQAEIHKKIMSLDYGGCRTEIKTVDSLDSLNGSVLVMVTGAVSRNTILRNFVQTFFLAPQEKGYYVLNDIFRYLGEESLSMKPVYPVTNGVLGTVTRHSTAPEQEHEERDLSPSPPSEEEAAAEDMYEIVEHTEVSEPGVERTIDDRERQEKVEVVSSETSATAIEPVLPAEELLTEKKSYASILRVIKENAGAHPTPSTVTADASAQTPAQGISELPTPSEQAAALISSSSAPSASDDGHGRHENEADGRSVYVRNLPMSITASQLEVEFSSFGLIKPNSVNVRSQRQGGCYAFVEFEDPNSAQSAIEASPIPIGGRQAYVEEKRPVASRGRGRFPQGRGMYRNDVVRGRGFYGGRGFFRGAAQDRVFSNRGRGSGPIRGGYGGANYLGNSDGYRRLDSQGARPMWRGSGNQMPQNFTSRNTASIVSNE
eukprot:c24608_g2_i1 orf=198-1664(+)